MTVLHRLGLVAPLLLALTLAMGAQAQQQPLRSLADTARDAVADTPAAAVVPVDPTAATDLAPPLPDLPVAVPDVQLPDVALPEAATVPVTVDAPAPPTAGLAAHAAPPAAPAMAAVAVGTSATAAFWLLPGTRRMLVLVGSRLRALAFGGAALLGFSRIAPDDVMEHATRARIVEAVQQRPGLTLRQVQAAAGVAWGTTVHHVRLLEHHGQLVSIRSGPRRLLYAANTAEARARDDLAALAHPTALAVATAVVESPGLDQGDLCHDVGLRAPAASKHLTRLEAAGLVEVSRRDGRCHYRATGRLEDAVRILRPVVTSGVCEPVLATEAAGHAAAPIAAWAGVAA